MNPKSFTKHYGPVPYHWRFKFNPYWSRSQLVEWLNNMWESCKP